jgi:hypothetical protein
MARYEHLPIYKKAMDLTIYAEKIVRSFRCYHKHGSPLEGASETRVVRAHQLGGNHDQIPG